MAIVNCGVLCLIVKFSCFCIMLILVVVLLTMMCSKAQKFRVDYMWAKQFKTFYRLHDLATDWLQARQICEAEGTSLLVPGDLDEIENLKLLLSNMRAHYTGIFIGLHDQFSHGNFVNLKGEPIQGTIFQFLWGLGKPDMTNGSEHCVIMTREGLLDDKPCDAIYPFVCEMPLERIVYNEKCDSYDTGYAPQSNGKCYKFHEEPLSWHDAYLVCRSEEGNLAVINSAEEASLITKFMAEHLHGHAPDRNILFIGFSDLMYQYEYRTVEGQTLEEAGYSSWTPMKQIDLESEPQRCGAICRTGFLQMTSCDQPAMFICQKPTQKQVEEKPTTNDNRRRFDYTTSKLKP